MEGSTKHDRDTYKKFRNMYNRTKRVMMKKYYSDKSTEFKSNTRKSWDLMNQMIGKIKNKGCSISCLTVEGVKVYGKKMIADEFAKFYSKVGETLASKITNGAVPVEQYLSQIPRLDNNLVICKTTPEEIEKIVEHLPNKSSSGHDRISNLLLKKMIKSLSYPLSIIFNQSIENGCFPDAMKIAEIIPLYKGKDYDQVENYRPVSLLMTMSKVLEKIIYIRLYKFLTKYKIFYDRQYGFRSHHSCKDAIL